MAHVLVLGMGRHLSEQKEFMAGLRDRGVSVTGGNLAHWRLSDPIAHYNAVYHDGTNAELVARCRELGVREEVFIRSRENDPRGVSETKEQGPATTVDPRVVPGQEGHQPKVEVREGRGWFTVFVDGEKLGVSKHTYEEALAQLSGTVR